MDIVKVNIVSVINRVIGELTAVRDALNTVGTQPTATQQANREICQCPLGYSGTGLRPGISGGECIQCGKPVKLS